MTNTASLVNVTTADPMADYFSAPEGIARAAAFVTLWRAHDSNPPTMQQSIALCEEYGSLELYVGFNRVREAGKLGVIRQDFGGWLRSQRCIRHEINTEENAARGPA